MRSSQMYRSTELQIGGELFERSRVTVPRRCPPASPAFLPERDGSGPPLPEPILPRSSPCDRGIFFTPFNPVLPPLFRVQDRAARHSGSKPPHTIGACAL